MDFALISNEELIVSLLHKLLENQEQTLAMQKQASESQQKAINNQQVAVKVATRKMYRLSASLLAFSLGLLVFYFMFVRKH